MVKIFPYSLDHKRKKFKKMQEAARKDVELAFGVWELRISQITRNHKINFPLSVIVEELEWKGERNVV